MDIGTRHLKRLQLGLRVLSRIRLRERHTIYLWAALVGFLGACAAMGFQFATDQIKWLLTGHKQDGYVAIFAQLEPWQCIAVPLVGGICAGLLLHFGKKLIRTRETDYMEAVALGDGTVPAQASLVRSGSALFSIASGAAIGREGPLVQLAAVASSAVGKLRSFGPPKRRLLVACGAASGLAAAYHAPLGGAIFVAEIVLGSFAMDCLGPLLLSSIVAVLTIKNIGEYDSLYHFEGGSIASMSEYILYPFLGVLCGIISVAWMRLLKASRFRIGALPGPLSLRLGLGGAVVGALAIFCPEVTGNGASVIRGMLHSEYTIAFVGIVLLLKILATCAVFGSGAVGGVFTPSLLVGAASGVLFSHVAGYVWPGAPLSPGSFALAGMTGLLAAAAQAPFTAIVMLFEMTMRYDLMPPLALAALAAYSTSRALQADGLYGESLRSGPRSVFDLPLASVSVKNVLRPNPRTVELSTSFAGIARAYLGGAGRELWVVGRNGKLMGEIFLEDVQPYLKEAVLAQTVIASDLLQEHLPRLNPTMSLTQALDVFSRTTAESLPVVEPETGKLLGSVGRGDVYLTFSEVARRDQTRAE